MSYKIYSLEEEKDMVLKAKTDEKIHLLLFNHIKRYYNAWMVEHGKKFLHNAEDLIQELYLLYVDALNTYDPEYNVLFRVYMYKYFYTFSSTKNNYIEHLSEYQSKTKEIIEYNGQSGGTAYNNAGSSMDHKTYIKIAKEKAKKRLSIKQYKYFCGMLDGKTQLQQATENGITNQGVSAHLKTALAKMGIKEKYTYFEI